MAKGNLPTTENCPILAHLARSMEGRFVAPSEEFLARTEALALAPGKRLQKKRAQMRQFESAAPGWRVLPLTRENLDAAYALERQCQTGENDWQTEFVRRCFRDFFDLPLAGWLLTDGTRPVGYAVGTEAGEHGAYVLALRALPQLPGVTAVLYREFCRGFAHRMPGLVWVNLGWLGGAEERQIRLSYSPKIISPAKEALRRRLLAARAAKSPRERCFLDNAITLAVIKMPQYQQANLLLCFLSAGQEISTKALVGHAILAGKAVAVPRWAAGKMEFCVFTDYITLMPDGMGFLQPSGSAEVVTDFDHAFCVVPALAVDSNGNRLGYGGGYYDRFLRSFPGFAAALAYSDCLLDNLPTHPGDCPVHCVITPNGPLALPKLPEQGAYTHEL